MSPTTAGPFLLLNIMGGEMYGLVALKVDDSLSVSDKYFMVNEGEGGEH